MGAALTITEIKLRIMYRDFIISKTLHRKSGIFVFSYSS